MSKWVTIVILSAILALHNAQRLAPVPLFNELRYRLAIDYTGVGNLFSAFLIAYALCHIPVGMLADRIDNKKLVIVGVAIALLGSTVFAISESYLLTVAMRFVLGIASAFLYIPVIRYIVAAFSKKERGSVMGFVEVGAGAGQILSLVLLPFMAEKFDLTGAFLCLPLLSLIILLGILIGLRSVRKTSVTADRGELSSLLRTGRFWNLIAFHFLGMLAAYAVLGWLPTYLRTEFGYSSVQAGLMGALVNLAVAVCSPLAGIISDRMTTRIPVLVAGSVLSLPCFGLLLVSHNTTVVLVAALLVGASIAFTIPVLMILVGESFETVGAGLAVSIVGTLGQISSSLSGSLFGYILDSGGGFFAVWGLAMVFAAGRIPFLLRKRNVKG